MPGRGGEPDLTVAGRRLWVHGREFPDAADVGGDTIARSRGLLRPGGRLAAIAALIDAGALRSVVGATFPLAEARPASTHRPVHGKVVLTL